MMSDGHQNLSGAYEDLKNHQYTSGFFLKWKRSSKIMQNVIYHCQTVVPDVKHVMLLWFFFTRITTQLRSKDTSDAEYFNSMFELPLLLESMSK